MKTTRRDRAQELHRRLERGPFLFPFSNTITEEEFKEAWQRWTGSWILDDLVDLIPELKADRKAVELLAASLESKGEQ